MGLETRDLLVGQLDINKQFDEGNMQQNMSNYDQLIRNGDYVFGSLTAMFFDLKKHPHEYETWMDDASSYPDFAKQKIMKTVGDAFNNIKNGHRHPLPIKWTWKKDPALQPAVNVSQDDKSFYIEIVNLNPPPESLLAQRREKRNKK
jgi:hypothetical protein